MTHGGIALFIPALDLGGAQMVLIRLANHWVAHGVPVRLVLASAHGVHMQRLDPRVPVVDLGAGRTRQATVALARFLRAARPTVLMSALEHANAVAYLATRLARVDLVFVCSAHNAISHAVRAPTPMRRLLGSLVARAYASADCVVAVSEAVAADVASCTRVARSAIEVIYNPLDLARIRELAAAEVFTVPGRPWFVAAGRLEPVKDFATLLRSFRRVRAETGAALTILGEGSERTALERLRTKLGLEEAVHLPGFMSNPYPAIAQANALVLSSEREGFGLVLAEAMALGTQVVTTDAGGGPVEVVSGGRHGRIAPSGDVDGLADAMLGTLREPIDPRKLLARAADFDVATVQRRYLEVLAAASRRAGRAPDWPADVPDSARGMG